MFENFWDFWDRVRNRAYHKYLHRISEHLPGDAIQDWLNAELEEMMEDKIRQEAFLHYLRYGYDEYSNYIDAKKDVMGRIQFIAFYLHENDYNKTPTENWAKAQKLYVHEF